MPFSTGGNARIRTNTAAENAYNNLDVANRNISTSQLRLSTGKRINNAGDDVAGYITSKALTARNGLLKSALFIIGDASNVTNILMDALDNINGLITQIKDSTATASSGALGTDEKVALGKAAYRMAQQIQTVVDSTVFGGQQLLSGTYSASFLMGSNATHSLITLGVDMTKNNIDFNLDAGFSANALGDSNFGGITGLDLRDFNSITGENLGIFSDTMIGATLTSLAEALNNVNKVGSYLGGISNRITSQEDLLKGQIVNYNAAISRLEDTDVAKEQLNLIRNQFLQQASLASLTQANQNPQSFLQLIKGQ